MPSNSAAARAANPARAGDKFSVVIRLAAPVLLLAGCYLSPVPLEESPTVRVDPALLGTWTGTGKNAANRTLIVRAKDDYRYTIDNQAKGGQTRYVGFASRIGGKTIFSFRKPNTDDWNFAIVRRTGNTAQIRFLSAKSTQKTFHKSAELRAVVERLLMDGTAVWSSPYAGKRVENTASSAELLSRGFAKQEAKQYDEARRLYLRAAELGNSWAQIRLGLLYQFAQGVELNYPEARRWYLEAADQDNHLGQYLLSLLYLHGSGVAVDTAEALHWLKLGAAAGAHDCQNVLGEVAEARGNYREALRWYRKAVAQDDMLAQYYLGRMYEKGRGVRRNLAEARRLYRLSADQGLESAEKALQHISSR